MTKFPTSKLSRLSKMTKSILTAGANVAIDYAQNKMAQDPKLDELKRKAQAASILVKSMGELKGGFMKLGQMISISEDLVLPPEIAQIFSSLQTSSPPMSQSDLQRVFHTTFQKSPLQVFDEFEMTPIAQASIGQVHMAKKDGKKLAVKVQYPDIGKAVRNDLDNLHLIDQLLNTLWVDKPNLDNYLQEIKRSLIEECDYEMELQNLQFFKTHLGRFKDKIIIPEVYPALSGKHVLTMEYVEGDSFADSKNYDQATRDELGQTLYEFYLYSLFQIKRMHTDPQHGNYLFHKNKIILLDFGSIRSFSDDFLGKYNQLIDAVEFEDVYAYRESLLQIGFFNEQDSIELLSEHLRMIRQLYMPYMRAGRHPVQPVNPIEQIKTFSKLIKMRGRSTPRQELLLLDRAHLGLYSKLKAWNSQIDWVNPRNQARGK